MIEIFCINAHTSSKTNLPPRSPYFSIVLEGSQTIKTQNEGDPSSCSRFHQRIHRKSSQLGTSLINESE